MTRQITSMHLNNGEPSVKTIVSSNNDFNIVRLNSVEPGDISTVSQQVKDAARRVIAQRNGQSLMASYLSSLSDSLAPQINQDLL